MDAWSLQCFLGASLDHFADASKMVHPRRILITPPRAMLRAVPVAAAQGAVRGHRALSAS